MKAWQCPTSMCCRENWGFLDYGTRSGQFCGNWWRSSCFSAFHIHEKFLRQPSWQFEDGIPFNLSMSCLCKLWRVTKLKGWCFHSHEDSSCPKSRTFTLRYSTITETQYSVVENLHFLSYSCQMELSHSLRWRF